MVDIQHLTKEYAGFKALDDLSLRIEAGDTFGFIGPNGAGKTTTIKILATLLEPTSGEARVAGLSVLDDPEGVRERLGYMPDAFGVYDGMRVHEYLEFFAAAYRSPRRERSRLVNDVLELTEMTPRRHDFVEALSVGLRQRLCLAKTLIHDPAVLVLDEPASGLDPRARIEFRELMKALSGMGKTIIVSSHILPELADFCNKIGIIEAGRLLEFGTVDEVLARVQSGASRRINVRFTGDLGTVRALLEKTPGVEAIRDSNHGSALQLDFGGSLEAMSELLERLATARVGLLGFWEEQTDLEDVFMKITHGGVGSGAGETSV